MEWRTTQNNVRNANKHDSMHSTVSRLVEDYSVENPSIIIAIRSNGVCSLVVRMICRGGVVGLFYVPFGRTEMSLNMGRNYGQKTDRWCTSELTDVESRGLTTNDKMSNKRTIWTIPAIFHQKINYWRLIFYQTRRHLAIISKKSIFYRLFFHFNEKSYRYR